MVFYLHLQISFSDAPPNSNWHKRVIITKFFRIFKLADTYVYYTMFTVFPIHTISRNINQFNMNYILYWLML